jgi:hypothetical protein
LQLVIDGYGRVIETTPIAMPAPITELPMSGDCNGETSASVVVAIQGNAVASTPPTAGQVLLQNSSATGSMWSGLTGDVQLSSITPGKVTVTGLDDFPLNIPELGVNEDGYVATYHHADGYIEFLPPMGGGGGGGGGSFTAGGDLSGTSTSQTVVGIQNMRVLTPTPNVIGTVLTYNEVWLEWDAIKTINVFNVYYDSSLFGVFDSNYFDKPGHWTWMIDPINYSTFNIILDGGSFASSNYDSSGFILTIKDAAGCASSHNIVITDNSGCLFDGQSSYIISSNYGSVNLIFSRYYDSGADSWTSSWAKI